MSEQSNTESGVINTSENDGKNTDNPTGNENTGTDNSSNNQEPKEKLLPQVEVDKLVGKARTEGRDAGKRDALKQYEGKKIFDSDDALEAYVNQRIEDYKAAQKLETVKQSIKAEYGLTDKQLERLTGDNEDDLKKDAEELFGALKQKKAPVINTGNASDEDNEETAKRNELFSKLDKIPTRVKK